VGVPGGRRLRRLLRGLGQFEALPRALAHALDDADGGVRDRLHGALSGLNNVARDATPGLEGDLSRACADTRCFINSRAFMGLVAY